MLRKVPSHTVAVAEAEGLSDTIGQIVAKTGFARLALSQAFLRSDERAENTR